MSGRARARHCAIGSLVAMASAGHLLYPAWLAWATRGRDERTPPDRDPERGIWPAITVLVPAFREAGVIGAKVKDVQANGYDGPLAVVVIADGDPETAAVAELAGARAITGPERLGKSQALNLGFAEAGTPIVVISDANNRLVPGALSALIRHFDDPAVGAVAGEKVEDDGGGESIYWRFESWLKRREDRLGSTIGLIGELSAIRSEAWRPIPEDIAIDDLWAGLDINEQGYSVAYEPRARAVDPPGASLSVQWERRTRNVAGALHVLNRRRSQLRPSAGLVAAEIWGHRLIRFTVSPIAHVLLVAAAALRVRHSRLAQVFLLGHVLAGWALWREAQRPVAPDDALLVGTGEPEASPGPVGTAIAAAGQVLFLQGVALGGLVRYLRGDRRTKWSTVER